MIALGSMIAALLFSVWPLLRQHAAGESLLPSDELLSQRDLALNDIRDVDFDRDLGNLSEEDHRVLRDRYKRHAVSILKQLNAQDGQLDDEIEQAVAALRKQPPLDP